MSYSVPCLDCGKSHEQCAPCYPLTCCVACGKPHGLRDGDTGSEREIERLCEHCFDRITRKKGAS